MKYLFLVIFIVVASAAHCQDQTTFILTRHAEKETVTSSDQALVKDPPLSKEGEERALKLKALLEKQSINVILSTNYKRTKSTIQPLADAKGITITTYETLKGPQIEELISRNRGGTVLIAGHSNTTPKIANLLLGSEKFADYDDSDFGNILIITVTAIGKGSVTHLRY